MTNVTDVINALNAVPNINASLNGNGELVVASTFGGTSGVAINPMTSDVGALNQNFSHYFGLNDMFDGQGAETLDVTSFLQNNNDYLAAGSLSTSLTLAPGDRGVARGDGSVADAMADLLIGNVSFNAAGNFAAQTNTLKKYIQAIVSNAASRSQIADQEADTAQVIYQQTKDVLSNKTGVNIDEETAKMVELQTKYQASASVIATIRTCFSALLDAVR
jgi:flagellar hook-associated protein 1 FlgK